MAAICKRNLAVHGAPPVRRKAWPSWPISTPETEQEVLGVLRSGRWTISGPAVPAPLREREFARRFAAYNGVRFCVPTANGSSALIIALEALDIGPGDEVIVPVLTWVATASSVLRVNATPVLVDIDADTLCLSVNAARAAVTERTRAILAVHLHHSMADIDALLQLSRETGIPLIEDAAQAHGALWRGQRAGTFGRLGAFSFQQSKVLTGGEGGAVITNDEHTYERLQELRADSRRWVDQPRDLDGMQLVASGQIMGANYCLSELHAAILLGQLPQLEEQLERRAANAEYLDRVLKAVGYVQPLRQPAGLQRRAVYEYVVRVDRTKFGDRPVERICKALAAELQLSFYPTDPPLHRSALYRPLSNRRFLFSPERAGQLDPGPLRFPVAEAAHANGVVCHHAAFLATQSDMDDIVAAFEKLSRYADEI